MDTSHIYKILGRREVQILQLIVKGYSCKKIAEMLNISFYTVRTHHQNIRVKTGAYKISELMTFAKKHNLLD